jgi:hypothetical protein
MSDFHVFMLIGLVCRLKKSLFCTDHLFSAQIQPKPLPKHIFTSIMQLLHYAIREMQTWNQLLVICLDTPPVAYLGAFHAFLWPGTQPSPPSIKSPHKGANRISLTWGIQNILFAGSGPEIFWRPPPILLSPPIWPPTNRPLRNVSCIYQSIAFDVRILNVIYISNHTWRQYVIIFDASCSRLTWDLFVCLTRKIQATSYKKTTHTTHKTYTDLRPIRNESWLASWYELCCACSQFASIKPARGLNMTVL